MEACLGRALTDDEDTAQIVACVRGHLSDPIWGRKKRYREMRRAVYDAAQADTDAATPTAVVG